MTSVFKTFKVLNMDVEFKSVELYSRASNIYDGFMTTIYLNAIWRDKQTEILEFADDLNNIFILQKITNDFKDIYVDYISVV